ncbi:MAG: helix-turn-helix domain-containing protein [Elusimicrobiota bacterium]
MEPAEMGRKSAYTTLEGTQLSLAKLTVEERRVLGKLTQKVKEGVSYLDFENLYMAPSTPLHAHVKRLGRPLSKTPLYQVCEDMSKRIGIRQGYLVQEEVVEGFSTDEGEQKEHTTGEVAKMAGCTREGVRKAIRTGRLRARRVGRLSLIREEDALAFVRTREDALHHA